MANKGYEFEERLEDLLDGLKRTAKSGGHWDNADLANEFTLVEAKVKSLDNFRAPKGELTKLKNQAEKHGKDWVYIQKNDSGEYALLDLRFFITLWNLLGVK